MAYDEVLADRGATRWRSPRTTLTRPGVPEFDFTGRPMKGFGVVDGEHLDDEGLANWLSAAREFAGSLPPKR